MVCVVFQPIRFEDSFNFLSSYLVLLHMSAIFVAINCIYNYLCCDSSVTAYKLKFASTSCSRYGNIISTKAILHKDTNQCKGLHIYSIVTAYEIS